MRLLLLASCWSFGLAHAKESSESLIYKDLTKASFVVKRNRVLKTAAIVYASHACFLIFDYFFVLLPLCGELCYNSLPVLVHFLTSQHAT